MSAETSIHVNFFSMVLCLQFSAPNVAREVAEQWYASLPDVTIEYLAQNQDMDNPIYAACMNTIEIYLLKVLGGMEEYDSAATFLEYNGFISHDKKKVGYAAHITRFFGRLMPWIA